MESTVSERCTSDERVEAFEVFSNGAGIKFRVTSKALI